MEVGIVSDRQVLVVAAMATLCLLMWSFVVGRSGATMATASLLGIGIVLALVAVLASWVHFVHRR